jgi:hypothetical protein
VSVEESTEYIREHGSAAQREALEAVESLVASIDGEWGSGSASTELEVLVRFIRWDGRP